MAKHKNQTLVERIRCMELASNSRKFPWAKTLNIATYLVNQSPTRVNSKVILKEKFTCIQPNLSNLEFLVVM
jgi:hypothetical protein